MDVAFVADPVTAAATPGLVFSKLASSHNLSLADSQSEKLSAVLQISAAMFNSTGRPPVKRNSKRGFNQVTLKRKRRAKRRSSDEGSGGDGGDNGFGGFGGGGRGWDDDGFGGRDWDGNESSPDWFSDVLFWIVISGCVHFAFWRVVRIVADGIRAAATEKGRLCAE